MPVVRGLGSASSATSSRRSPTRAHRQFRVLQESFNGEVFIDFLRRLVRARGKKVYPIVDRHPVLTSSKVQRCVEPHREEIRLIYLPPKVLI
jgi:hypothetical protein